MLNFLLTPAGRRFFMADGDQGGTPGNGEGGTGNANDQNNQQTQTSGGGSGEGNQGQQTQQQQQTQTGQQTGGVQISGGQQAQVSSGTSQQSNAGGSASTTQQQTGEKDWQKEYNSLAASIRTNEDKVKAAQTNEAAANQRAQTAVKERDEAIARAERAELDSTRARLIIENGIPAHLATLVTGPDEATMKSQIETIKGTLIGSGSSTTSTGVQNQNGNGAGNGTGNQNGTSGGGNGQATQDAGTGNGTQQSGSQDGQGNQTQQTSGQQQQSGSDGQSHIPPKPKGDPSKNFLERFQGADGGDRHKMMQDVIEGKTTPDFGK